MKQNNVFKRSLSKVASWTLAHTSWITMTLSPVAMGKQAEKNSVDYYKQQVHAIGLDQKITVKEFFEKIKADIPGNLYYELEQLAKKNPNALMPKFEVKSAKAGDGQTIPVITFTENGKTSTIQLYGEKEKFMKYNNVVVSENDSKNPADLFQKLIDNDSKLNQQYKDAVQKELRKTSSASGKKTKSISKFTEIDPKLWKTMTAEQRVSYIIYMRQLYLDAQNVLSEESDQTPAGKKTSSVNVFELLFQGFVPAAEAKDAEITAVIDGKKVKVKTNKSSKSCIVAGYVSQEATTSDDKTVCSVEVALKKARYQASATSPMPFVSDANKTCQSKGASFVACNPIVYSYDSKGQPHCIDRDQAIFQKATHWSNKKDTCDGKSKLTTNQELKLKNTQEYKNLSKEQMDKNGNLALTKEFIQNYLKSSGKADFVACLQNSVITDKCSELIKEITTIGTNFKQDINKAIQICNAGTGTADKKQEGACDQIRKRWLSFEALIAGLKCEDGSSPVDGKCSVKPVDPKTICPEGSTPSPTTEPVGKMCTCLTSSSDPKSEFFDPKKTDGKLPESCKPKVEPGACPAGSDSEKSDDKGMCSCTVPGDQDNDAQVFPFKSSEGLPEACKPLPEPPAEACSQYPPLKVGAELNTDCTCKNKEGANGNIPKEDQPGFFAKLFNTKKNKAFKKTETQNRPHSCKFGPNWWLIGGGALAIGGVVALLLHKKTKTVTNTVTNTVDNTVTCTAPKYPVLLPTTVSGSKPSYECVCPQSQRICHMANGSTYTVQANPITCDLALCPSEGGGGTPVDDSGGVPTQN